MVRKVQPPPQLGRLGYGLTASTEVVGALVVDLAQYATCGQQRLTLALAGGFSPPRLTISIALRSLAASAPQSPASPVPPPRNLTPPPPPPLAQADADQDDVVGCTRRLQVRVTQLAPRRHTALTLLRFNQAEAPKSVISMPVGTLPWTVPPEQPRQKVQTASFYIAWRPVQH